jgi:hypothetical protein
VPPKGWFSDVERPNLVRVPCCRICNEEQNAAEEEFRNVLALTRGKSTGEVYDRFLRSLTNAPGKRARILARVFRRDGRLVYPTLKRQFDRMFIKVAKGLYFQEFGASAKGMRAFGRLEPADRADAYRQAFGVVTRNLTPSFSYSFLGDAGVTIWWFEFSAGPTVVATLERQTLTSRLLDVAWLFTGSRWP